MELGSFFDFLQEAGQVVVNISTVSQYVHDAVWGAVCDHIVHLIVNTLQTALGFLIFRLAGKLLLPPGPVVDPEAGAHSAKGPVLFFVTGCFGVQNTVLDIMASGTAHGKEGVSLQVKDLPAHQVDHMRPDSLNLSAVPFLCRVFSQQVEVFMVAADEQRGKGQILQPVQIPLLLLAPIPYAAKISADDHVVFLGHSGLLGEVFGCELLEVAMGIAGCIDHFGLPSFAYYIISCST